MWPWRRDPAAIPKPGDVIAGKYRVEKVLGVGGMGMVVAARHTKLDEVVALKLLRPHVLRSRDDVARFLREGRACSKLKSEHVVRILDLGELHGEVPYLVMEHLEGRDLAAVLREHGPFSVTHAIDSVLEACEAVAEAHALGIVHRDLKPANLFLARTANGAATVKVLDFGISKLLDDGSSDPDLSLTTTRALMGSPLYMAPEVMRSARSADARSDVWALGVILYELLTGTTPFHGETVTELCIRVVEETPRSIARFREDVPAGLEAVVLRCLAKKPEDRFRKITDLAMALASFTGRRGHLELEQIDRVVLAAEDRVRRGRVSGAISGSNLGADETGEQTLRGWGTTRGAPRTTKRVAVLGVAALLSLAAVVCAIVVMRRSKEAAPPAAIERVVAVSPSPSPSPSASATPSAKASAPVTAAPNASQKAKPKLKPAGKPTTTSPYFDDPN